MNPNSNKIELNYKLSKDFFNFLKKKEKELKKLIKMNHCSDLSLVEATKNYQKDDFLINLINQYSYYDDLYNKYKNLFFNNYKPNYFSLYEQNNINDILKKKRKIIIDLKKYLMKNTKLKKSIIVLSNNENSSDDYVKVLSQKINIIRKNHKCFHNFLNII